MGNSKIVNMLAFSISWSFELPEPLKNLLILLPSLFLSSCPPITLTAHCTCLSGVCSLKHGSNTN